MIKDVVFDENLSASQFAILTIESVILEKIKVLSISIISASSAFSNDFATITTITTIVDNDDNDDDNDSKSIEKKHISTTSEIDDNITVKKSRRERDQRAMKYDEID